MAIAFGSIGTTAVGTTSLTISYPSGIAAGDLLVCCISWKYSDTTTPSTPAGWTRNNNNSSSGTHGSAGIDTGLGSAILFTRVADGTESGSLSVTITSGNSAVGAIIRYTKTQKADWSLSTISSSPGDNTPDTSYSVNGFSSFSPKDGDMVLAVSGLNTDAYTYSSQALTTTAITYSGETERLDTGTTQGQDCAIVISEHFVAGTATFQTPTYTMTASGSATDNPCGGTVLLLVKARLDNSFNNYAFVKASTSNAGVISVSEKIR